MALVALAIAGCAMVLGEHTRLQASLDVSDEGAHYDYVTELAHGYVPAWGDRLSQTALRVAECAGSPGRAPASCAAKHRDARTFPAEGYSYEAQQPPLGYLPYVVAYDMSGAQPGPNLVHTRLGGWAWILLAAILLLALGVVEGLSWPGFIVLCTCSLLSPVFVHAASTVNNDAAGVAAGAAVCLVATFARRRGRPMTLLALGVGVVVGLVKGLFFAAPLALVVAQLLVERPWSRPRVALRPLLQRLGTGLTLLAGVVGAYVGWTVVQDARGRVPSGVVLRTLLSFRHTGMIRLDTIFIGLQALAQLYESYSPDGPVYVLWNLAVFGSLIGVLTVARRGQVSQGNRALAVGILAGLLALALAWPTVVYLQGHYDFGAATRYGIPLLPLIGLLLARTLRRWALVAVGVVLPAVAAISQLVSGGF